MALIAADDVVRPRTQSCRALPRNPAASAITAMLVFSKMAVLIGFICSPTPLDTALSPAVPGSHCALARVPTRALLF